MVYGSRLNKPPRCHKFIISVTAPKTLTGSKYAPEQFTGVILGSRLNNSGSEADNNHPKQKSLKANTSPLKTH
jgi:hypothetical protein